MQLTWAQKNPKLWLVKWKEVVIHNLTLLEEIVSWNQERGVRLYRISSDLIPFADHPVFGQPWRAAMSSRAPWLQKVLRPVVQRISASMEDGARYSMHPGQFVSISSSSQTVRQSSICNLEYHAALMDSLGLPRSVFCPINIHIGNGSKGASSVEYTTSSLRNLSPGVMSRLVFENEQHGYWTPSSIFDHFPAVPVTLDYHHLLINPDPKLPLREIEKIIAASWDPSPPICHWSEGRSSRLDAAHSDYIRSLPDTPFDIEVEAKAKDLAILPFISRELPPPPPRIT
jgi:UV DNA damage endonuclease